MSDQPQNSHATEPLRSQIERKMICVVAAEPSRATKADEYQALAQVARTPARRHCFGPCSGKPIRASGS